VPRISSQQKRQRHRLFDSTRDAQKVALGMLHELAISTGKRLLLYCAFGERSAMAVQSAQDTGLSIVCHLQGGFAA
jgi:rhodanese-related sulfurtransferase